MKDAVFRSEIAHHLKNERKRKNLSLDATSKLTGVSKAMLGQIEREESSPTISTLWKISSGLEVSFSAFFAGERELHSSKTVFPEDSKMAVKTLFPYQKDSCMEMFEVTLSDYHRQLSSPHATGIIEHVVVLSGHLNVLLNDERHLLKTGEALRFYSDQPHGYEAVTESVTFQNVICYPR